jgi:chorismate mutase
MDLYKAIFNRNRPFLIAGPCSAESEEQMFQVARDLKSLTKTSVLRAGIWKPRTRPLSFEGFGDTALDWLVKAGKENGLPTAVEVANKIHVETALKAGVDVLWIGARTTVNPFTVQEIADALTGTEIPVLVKNPVNPDLELWIGAIERLQKAGLNQVAAVHRGFSYYNHIKYRNVPQWEIPIALRERMPEVPIICDPSHITGATDLIQSVSQKAMDLNFDGLMIEVHPQPDAALSDAKQQITPSELADLIQNLVIRNHEVSPTIEDKLKEMRDKIAILDDRIFELLSARMKMSAEVGAFKREHHVTIFQQEHWKQMLIKRLDSLDELALSDSFVRRLMDEIHQESIRHQTKVMNPKHD